MGAGRRFDSAAAQAPAQFAHSSSGHAGHLVLYRTQAASVEAVRTAATGCLLEVSVPRETALARRQIPAVHWPLCGCSGMRVIVDELIKAQRAFGATSRWGENIQRISESISAFSDNPGGCFFNRLFMPNSAQPALCFPTCLFGQVAQVVPKARGAWPLAEGGTVAHHHELFGYLSACVSQLLEHTHTSSPKKCVILLGCQSESRKAGYQCIHTRCVTLMTARTD